MDKRKWFVGSFVYQSMNEQNIPKIHLSLNYVEAENKEQALGIMIEGNKERLKEQMISGILTTYIIKEAPDGSSITEGDNDGV